MTVNLMTIARPAQGSYSISSSKFYSFTFHVNSFDAIRKQCKLLKEKYSDASHICYAYRLIIEDRLDEFSTDAGEPGGSSGTPILNQIKRENLVNTVIYVIRYFGGTKLGISGLKDAYGKAAQECLENAHVIKWVKMVNFKIKFPFELKGIVDSIIYQTHSIVTNQVFSEDILIDLKTPDQNKDKLHQLIDDKCAGILILK